MSDSFAAKLDFVLKALPASRGQCARALGVNKSLVSRWCSGAARPSGLNLARLTQLVSARFPGFSQLDWERPLAGLAQALGLDPTLASSEDAVDGLPIAVLRDARALTAQWGRAYEGLYRTTRPFAQLPGRFVRDHMLVRLDPLGLLRFELASQDVRVDGWVLPLKGQLFVIGSELASRSMVFGLFNGVNVGRAETIDGLVLLCTLDLTRTPVATAMLLERIGDVTADAEADRARLAALSARAGLIPEGELDPAVAGHLARDIGPTPAALGGEWVLASPLALSLSKGVIPLESAG